MTGWSGHCNPPEREQWRIGTLFPAQHTTANILCTEPSPRDTSLSRERERETVKKMPICHGNRYLFRASGSCIPVIFPKNAAQLASEDETNLRVLHHTIVWKCAHTHTPCAIPSPHPLHLYSSCNPALLISQKQEVLCTEPKYKPAPPTQYHNHVLSRLHT